MVGAYGIMPEALAQKGQPQIGDLVCWLGDSKAGKSFALSQCGLTAARLGYPVLHFSSLSSAYAIRKL